MKFKRSIEINEEYRTMMFDDMKISSSKVQEYLLNHSLRLANYIDDWRKMKRDLIRLQKEFNEFKKDKWIYYRFKYDYKTDNKDAEKLMDVDKEIIEYNTMINIIELDIDTVKKFMDALSNKTYSINNWLKLRMFENGE